MREETGDEDEEAEGEAGREGRQAGQGWETGRRRDKQKEGE